jgi:hypothetical protein
MGLQSDRSDEAEGLRPDACLVISRLGLVGQRVRGNERTAMAIGDLAGPKNRRFFGRDEKAGRRAVA